jgi:isopentenyl phosphate kinase
MGLIFLKLGGSLITDKAKPYTPRPEIIKDAASQIASAKNAFPDLAILLGHGSGSFGHVAAIKFNTIKGVSGDAAWGGFTEVWYQASNLNRIVIDVFHQVGLPVVTISPLSSITALDGNVTTWDISPVIKALEKGLLPIVHGDVVFDTVRGGTILSTEVLFNFLARELHPQHIYLAGHEEGVWADFPERNEIIKFITPKEYLKKSISTTHVSGIDVTGGMQSKIADMVKLIQGIPDCEVHIFSGEIPGNIYKALSGETIGTMIHN